MPATYLNLLGTIWVSLPPIKFVIVPNSGLFKTPYLIATASFLPANAGLFAVQLGLPFRAAQSWPCSRLSQSCCFSFNQSPKKLNPIKPFAAKPAAAVARGR